MRRALLGGARLLLILAGLTLATVVISLPLEAWAEQRAREQGLLDMTTSY